MTVRETLEGKAARLLVAGRLTVLEVGLSIVRATCWGDSGRMWRLGWWRGAWGCSCPAGQFRADSCAHVLALCKVVAKPGPEDADAGPGLTPVRMREAQREATAIHNGTARRSA